MTDPMKNKPRNIPIGSNVNLIIENPQYIAAKVAIVSKTPAIKVARATSCHCCEYEKPRKPYLKAFCSESSMMNVTAVEETTNHGASNETNAKCANGILDNGPKLKASVATKAIGNIVGVASPEQRICRTNAGQRRGSKIMNIKRDNRSGLSLRDSRVIFIP